MYTKRGRLPPLDLLQGFEAAARTLSFTKAAEELNLTQSAISRQIRTLEQSLGVELFIRRPRAIALTAEGQLLFESATRVLSEMSEIVLRLRAGTESDQICVTTSTSFASLWLIPRLSRFALRQPHIDVRISATDRVIDLARDKVDLAVRYCRAEDAPRDAIPLNSSVTHPVCSPGLLAQGPPLREPTDLRNHVLLHTSLPDVRRAYVDWDMWLAAVGLAELKPAGNIYFSQFDQMIQAALLGQGIALGMSALIDDHLRSGALTIPFPDSVAESRSSFLIRAERTKSRPVVEEFIGWLLEEASVEQPG